MLKELFLKRWVVIGNAILLAYSIATTFRDAFSTATEQKYQLNVLLHHWSWQTWIAIFAVGNFFVVLNGASLAIRRRESEKRKLAAKLDDIEKAEPRITLKQPSAIYVQDVAQKFTDGYSYIVPFLKVRFVNDPPYPCPSAKANGVRAKIQFYRHSDNSHLLSIDGRWAESTQPPAIHPLESKSHLLAATFGIGEERSLDVAYRDGETRRYFAWNNDNYNHHHFRCEDHLLKGDHFRVDIRLRGEWIDQTFSFAFKTKLIGGGGFEIEEIMAPS